MAELYLTPKELRLLRERVIRTGVRLYRELGEDGLSVVAIGRATGYSPVALYELFEEDFEVILAEAREQA